MRVASVIGLRPDHEQVYRDLHLRVWPDVLAALRRAHVSNYSIFLRDGQLFSYLEYGGVDFKADMEALARDSVTRRWWELTDPCQLPLATAAAGERWAPAEELFHLD